MPKANPTNSQEIGFVKKSLSYLMALEGLPSARTNGVLVDDEGQRALVTDLKDTLVEAILLEHPSTRPGIEFNLSARAINLPVGEELLGRVVDPLAVPLDGKGSMPSQKIKLEFDLVASGIASRALVTEQLFTGVMLVDILVPIGKGQRELIFGEPRSGKTSFILDVIANQKGQDVVCIYAILGKEEIEVRRFANRVEELGAGEHTIIFSASSAMSAPMIAIAPTTAFAVAEYFRSQGRDVLLILDDLGTHAKYLREMALLSGRIPGRESYPGDIFHRHAQLMERAGNFNAAVGGGSITLLPVIETDLENFSTLIPTNLMSATDGHLLFASSSRLEGMYPAIDVDRSVSRVGRQTQSALQQELSFRLRVLLSEFGELDRFSRFDTEFSPETELKLRKGRVVRELLAQGRQNLIDLPTQILLLALVFTPFFETRSEEYTRQHRRELVEVLRGKQFKGLSDELGQLSLDEIVDQLSQQLSVIEEACQ